LLWPAGCCFHLQLYTVVSLPHVSPEPPVAGVLCRLAPVAGSSYPEVLLLAHRAALEADWSVRLAVPGDMVSGTWRQCKQRQYSTTAALLPCWPLPAGAAAALHCPVCPCMHVAC
jgi:hypothetical protein